MNFQAIGPLDSSDARGACIRVLSSVYLLIFTKLPGLQGGCERNVVHKLDVDGASRRCDSADEADRASGCATAAFTAIRNFAGLQPCSRKTLRRRGVAPLYECAYS